MSEKPKPKPAVILNGTTAVFTARCASTPFTDRIQRGDFRKALGR